LNDLERTINAPRLRTESRTAQHRHHTTTDLYTQPIN